MNAPRKNMSMVRAEMSLSALGRYQWFEALGSGIPNAFRPKALRIRLSKCSSAAVVAGDVPAGLTERDVAVNEMGGGRCVARNMW
jgi:hypothetical protein